jgi:hypothetical protein
MRLTLEEGSYGLGSHRAHPPAWAAGRKCHRDPQSGRTSGLDPRVTCFSAFPLGFIVQMWGGVLVVAWAKAMRLPLGDQTGSNEKLFLGSFRTRLRPLPLGRTV